MKRHIAYFKYVARHKWFVFLACLRLRVPLWRAIVHDWTRYLPVEWGACAHTFFNEDGTRKDIRKSPSYDPNNAGDVSDFTLAWIHHQKNKHHWQAWVSIGDKGSLKPFPIPETYVREMIADWIGAGTAISGEKDPRPWYEKNKQKMILHSETRKKTEELLLELV